MVGCWWFGVNLNGEDAQMIDYFRVVLVGMIDECANAAC